VDPVSTAAGEAVSSTSAAASATACVDCLVSFGVDPSVAVPLAVVLAVGVRLLVDWAQRRLAARRERLALATSSPKEPPDPGDLDRR